MVTVILDLLLKVLIQRDPQIELHYVTIWCNQVKVYRWHKLQPADDTSIHVYNLESLQTASSLITIRQTVDGVPTNLDYKISSVTNE